MKDQMKKVAIAGLIMSLSFVALAQIPSDANLVVQVTAHAGTNIPGVDISRISPGIYISGVVSNTESDVRYEMQYMQNKINWISLGFFDGSEITNCQPFSSWITNTIDFSRKAFRIRSWRDSWGLGIADWWQIKYFGNIGIDAYANPMGDGFNNLNKYGNGMDPFKWYQPAAPEGHVVFQKGIDAQHENAVITWQCNSGPIPDTVLIERARREIAGRHDFSAIRRTVNGRIITNRPPPSISLMYDSLVRRRDNLVITGAYEVVTQLPVRPDVREYRYVDSNLDYFPPPVYRVSAHYPEPVPFAQLSEVTATSISNTILAVTAKQRTNGYELIIRRFMPHARYLLLVRDKIDRQWRASGYFVSGTNQAPIHLHVDKRGMMTDKQSPIALPEVKFLPDVVKPEFTAGWGEDSDGDSLPDIYEVLVTHTKPDDVDTGDTGIPDGYRVFADDGWNNWQKFLYRANPFEKCEPPPAIELKHPTISEMMKAGTLKTDLPYELQHEIRTNDSAGYLPYSLWLDSNYLAPRVNGRARGDLRVSWKVPLPKP